MIVTLRRWSSVRWNGYVLATSAVAAALCLRLALEPMGRFYYLPLVLGLMAPAFLADRRATALAIVLSIAANLILVSRESVTDAVVNALLFAAVGALIGELGRARRRLKSKSADLSTRLQARQAMLGALLTSVPVVTVTQDERVAYMSPTACRLFRVTEDEAKGRRFRHFVEHFDLAAPNAHVIGGHGPFWSGRRSDGERFPLDIQPGYIPDGAGGCGVVLCLTDLSSWHASEARSQDLAVQLNHVWRLNSLGEMAAILAHELNQPLTAASAYLQASQADLDRAGLIGASASRSVDMAKGQILRAGAIIRRMRDLLTTDGQGLRPVRVSSMIEDLNPVIALLAPGSDAQVRVEVDTGDDLVLADTIQIQQALVNLVRNAIEAVSGHAHRDVLVYGRPLSDGRFGIGVEDSGPGIASGQEEAVFRPLTTTKAQGMGLGLSVTRTIVERHGGALTVRRSGLGGAAFEFSLSRISEAEAAIALEAARA